MLSLQRRNSAPGKLTLDSVAPNNRRGVFLRSPTRPAAGLGLRPRARRLQAASHPAQAHEPWADGLAPRRRQRRPSASSAPRARAPEPGRSPDRGRGGWASWRVRRAARPWRLSLPHKVHREWRFQRSFSNSQRSLMDCY